MTNIQTVRAQEAQHQNVLLQPFSSTEHNTPPFSQITNLDYEPAIDTFILKAKGELDNIANNPEPPSFDNTIVALERSGKDLDRVLQIFYNLVEADADDEMMEISLRVSPKISDYSTSIVLNQPLWKRIKAVWEGRESLNLSPEQLTLLEDTYDSFALSGADLQGDDRETFRRINAELSNLTTLFGQNVLKELATYQIWLNNDQIAGIPQGTIEEAQAAAEAQGRKGEYLFTLAMPTYQAVMKYAQDPAVREQFYRLYTGRNLKGEYANMDNAKKIAELRLQLANLLGSKTYAQHSLKRTMAKNPQNVYHLLDQLRDAYTLPAQKEVEEIAEFASSLEGKPVKIHPWDYSYYANKLKNARYNFDEEELRPYFELNAVTNGVFGLAKKLYGLTFTPNPKIEVYHPDVKAYDVTNEKGEFLGVIYTDFFPRDSKRPGAWMTEFRGQEIDANGIDQRPHISIVMNFTKPTPTKPSLLTPYEVGTFLHEFGHALHGLLTKCTYGSTSGTNVYRDFVELPSQFNENYLTQKEFLDSFARHYQTGDSIPQELVDRIIASAQFGAAYSCLRQLMFGYLDMAWHTLTEPLSQDPLAFEQEATQQVALFPPVEGAATSPQFSHIFAGGYAAGYYSYKWAEVLDADAFAKFKEDGIFNRATADSFRTNILERGGSEKPDILYRRFRGQEPSIDALLRRDGIKK